jgi:hypothetical protein
VAPRFTTLMYQIYSSDHGTDAIICFPSSQLEAIFPFRDKLAEELLKIDSIRVNQTQGSPLPPDSAFRFYREAHALSVEEFLQKRYPSFLSRIMNNAEWVSFQKEEKLVSEMIDVEIETSHDFPCVVVHSRIHSEESMSALLQTVARDLKMTLPRNIDLGPIRNIVISNERFELRVLPP